MFSSVVVLMLELLIPYEQFKGGYPAAAAVFDHAIRWLDSIGSSAADQVAIEKKKASEKALAK